MMDFDESSQLKGKFEFLQQKVFKMYFNSWQKVQNSWMGRMG